MNNHLAGGLGALLVGACSYWALRPTEERIRARVARIARSRIGDSNGAQYWHAVAPALDHTKSWCGVFALWALQQAGLAQGWTWNMAPNASGFLYRLPLTATPKMGDIAYFTKNQHHGVIVGVHGSLLDVINGNGSGGKVTLSTVQAASAAGIYSIQPLIDKTL